jgi:hypothetical protein
MMHSAKHCWAPVGEKELDGVATLTHPGSVAPISMDHRDDMETPTRGGEACQRQTERAKLMSRPL